MTKDIMISAQDSYDSPLSVAIIRQIRRYIVVLTLASLSVGAAVYVYLYLDDVQYESVAVVRGWRDVVSGFPVSDRELEVRVNSPKSLGISPSLGSEQQAPNDDVVIKVSWLPNSYQLLFSARGREGKKVVDALNTRLPLLLAAMEPPREVVQGLDDERQQILTTLDSLQSALRTGAQSVDFAAGQKSDQPGIGEVENIIAYMKTMDGRLKEIDAKQVNLKSNILVPPELPDHPMPSRALIVSIASMAAAFSTGIIFIIITASLISGLSRISRRAS